MKKALLEAWRNGRIFSGVLAVCLLAGCKGLPPLPPTVRDFGPAYHPSNVYRQGNVLPIEVRRVALLPLAATSATADLQAGIDTLEPLVYAELQKSKRFEVVLVTPMQMKQWTGQNLWRTDEQLPPDLLQRLSEATGCDAVLFCQLTRFQPYQPLAVGWKFSLIETSKAEGAASPARRLWSADEVLDAGDPGVATAARNYYAQHLRSEAASADPSTMLSSPARFGQYTLWTLFTTIPDRGPLKH
jgi:hypothetical protein